MGQEIERKFLVVGDFKHLAHDATRIRQGYLSKVPERTVRIRIRGEKGYLTIKGKVQEGGFKRFEWEKEITLTDAEQLMELCEPGVVDKTRYLVKFRGHIFEVDEFYGENKGLIMAELELRSEEEEFERPDWLGKEVTSDERYQNSSLTSSPYSGWSMQ